MPTARLAAIDVGTNTALLTVVERTPEGLRVLHEEERFVRLGEGVDAGKRIGEAALGRLIDALSHYRATADAWEAHPIVVGATSASRDAENRQAVVEAVRQATGLHYDILDGDEEAAWSFAGALSALPGLSGPCTVLDIGGGSTEIIVGRPGDAAPAYRQSLNIGSVRLSERLVTRRPPTPATVEALRGVIRDHLTAAAVPTGSAGPLVGASGTTTALALLEAGVSAWSDLGQATVSIDLERVARWSDRLLALTEAEVLALDPAVMTGRADVYPVGVLILCLVMRHMGASTLIASPRGLRHGLALRSWQHAPP